MWKKTKYFTFQEVLHLYPSFEPSAPNVATLDGEWFTKTLAAAGQKYNILGLSGITDADIKALVNNLMTIIYNRHHDEYLYSIDMEYNEDINLSISDFPKAIKDLINVLNLTAPKYIPLFRAFSAKSSDPIGKVESVTSGLAKFNDTPQGSGDYSDDTHATNVTKTSSTQAVDAGSIMFRLGEMSDKYRAIILDWANEFDILFLREEQL